jgi:glyceraldehyde-3-phosphate dehydrogenase (NADP+)
MIRERAAKKKVALELGGNAGVVVEPDADIEYAAKRCVLGGFSYAGQSCISVQRILVHEDVYNPFLDALLQEVGDLKTGDPMDEHTDVGPLIDEANAVRAEAWIQQAVAAGAEMAIGGGRNRSVLEPTVLTKTKPEMRVNCEEVFAPVVTVTAYTEFDKALQIVNDSPYGLQAGLFTNDQRMIWQAFETVEVGGLVVNDISGFRVDHMPYGGVKESGQGREGIKYAIREMTEMRLLVLS